MIIGAFTLVIENDHRNGITQITLWDSQDREIDTQKVETGEFLAKASTTLEIKFDDNR